MIEDQITRKEFDNALLFLALSHIDSAYRSAMLGSLMILQSSFVQFSSNDILRFIRKEINAAKKLAYMAVSLGYKEEEETVQKQRELIDDYIEKRHAEKIKILERATQGNLPLEALINAGIEDVILDYIIK